MITEKTVFVTEDGKEHDTKEAAQDWEFRNELVMEMHKNTALDILYSEEAADYILKHYKLESK